MNVAADCHDSGVIYDILLPENISAVVSMHWDRQSPLQRLGNRHVQLISCRLGDHFLGEHNGNIGKGRRRLGVSAGMRPVVPGSAECVVLHHVLEDPPVTAQGRAACREEVVRFCKGMLAPGGVLAVCCNNRWSFDLLRDRLLRRSPHLRLASSRNGLSLWGCRRLLQRAEFEVSEDFVVVPNTDGPAAIVSAQREAAQVFYGRAMARTSSNRSPWAMLLLRTLNTINARPYFESAFFVLARHA